MAGRTVSVMPFKPVFLESPGEPPIPWSRWLAMFNDYLLAVDFPTATEHAGRKAALLRASLGVEGYRVYSSLVADSREGFDDAVGHLAAHFEQKPSAIFERAQFTRRVQTNSESVAQFVAELREIAAKCGFDAAQLEERVRDQFVAWLHDPKIRERLLQEPDASTLQHMVQLALTLERSSRECPALGERQAVSRVHAGDYKPSGGGTCFNCGREGHLPKTPQCPALGRKCRKCGTPDHFANVCRQSKGKKPRGQGHRRHRSNSTSDSTTVSMVFHSTGELKTVCCVINNVKVSLTLDIGAKVSLLSRAVYDQHFSQVPLQTCPRRLQSYDGGDIVTVGCIRVTVQYADVTLPDFLFYVSASGMSVIGVDLFDALGFKVTDPLEARIAAVQQGTTVTLQQYPELTKEFGCITGYQHRPIVDQTVTPVRQPLRRLPLALRDEVSAELHKLMDLDLIEKVDASPWVSNLVLVRKKDNKLRICIDLTCVNKAIIPASYPLPTFDELTSQLAGSTLFSKIDLRWGYLQVKLAEDSRYLTTFITHEGLFQYKRLCFGISSGPSCFQQIVRDITAGLDGVVNLLDDLLIHGRTRQEHDRRLKAVLQRLSDHHATVNADKTVLGAAELDFDGFRISADGVRPMTSHTKALRELKAPANEKEVRSFLGATGFYMKFVPHYADIVDPLRNLLRGIEWNWSRDCQEAFEQVIDSIASASSLAHFDTSAKATTVLTTDASSIALGACLSQIINGEERPVAFASRVLTATERNYSATEREALACIWATEHWHFYLYGRKYILHTDHQALQMLLMAPGKGHRPLRLHRWADRLLQYNPDVQFSSGERVAMADYLSRMTNTDLTKPAELNSVLTIATIFGSSDIPVLLATELQVATAGDDTLKTVLRYVSKGWCARSTLVAELKPYHDVCESLSCSDEGLLMKDNVVVIPGVLRDRVLQLAHEGHPGIVKMKQRCRTTVWWPGMNNDIEHYVRHCVPCAVSGKSCRPTAPPLQPIDFPPRPWHTVAIDIFGEVTWAPSHQRFLIVLVDLHSKWPEVAACGTVTSASIINFLSDLFWRHGLPDNLISDNGPQFISNEFESFLSSHGIRHNKTAVYNPPANGACERFNKVLKEGLSVACAESSQFLPAMKRILANYRSLAHVTTGESPAKLFYGRELRMPLNCLCSSLCSSASSSTTLAVAKRVRFAQDKTKDYTDRVRHAKTPSFAPGDYIRTLRPFRSHKLDAKWSQPKKVVGVHNSTLTLVDGKKWNVRKCIKCDAPDNDTFTVEVDDTPAAPAPPSTPPPILRRGERIRHAPVRYSP